MRAIYISIVLSSFFLCATVTHATLSVTEIAWMGNADSQFGEWFELYNDSADSINLAGWKLYEDGGGQLVFTFTKSISGGGYPVPGVNDEAGSFGGSGFANTGEDLVLKDAQGDTVEVLSFLSGWPAGDATTKHTMQWDGTTWVTALATPKKAFEKTSEPVEVVSSPSTSAPSAPRTTPQVELVVPKHLYTSVSAEYVAETTLEYGTAYQGVFLWNMGDGTTYRSLKPEPIVHTYLYPGTYTISFAYYRYAYDTKAFLSQSITRTVTDPGMLFSIREGKGLLFSNNATVPFDVSGWIVTFPDRSSITLPVFSIIAPKETVLMPFAKLGITSYYTSALLQTPEYLAISSGASTTPPSRQASTFISGVQVGKASTPLASSSVAEAAAVDTFSEQGVSTRKPNKKSILFGIALVLVVGLFVGIERFIVSKRE
jgi:hypothetical protein